MCRIKERSLQNQLKINAKEIDQFEQKLLSSLSTLHKMRHSQAELQALLHEESRERLTTTIKRRTPRPLRVPKTLTIEDALTKMGWTIEEIKKVLAANPGWRTKEVKI